MRLAKNLLNKNCQENLAKEKYFQIMQRKSGQARLKIALELRKLALKFTEAQIKEKNPKISSKELKRKIQERIYGFALNSKISD